MKYEIILPIFLLVISFSVYSQEDDTTSTVEKNWYKFTEPTFLCPVLIIDMERYNNLTFSDYIWHLMRPGFLQNIEISGGRFVAEFEINKESKTSGIETIERIENYGRGIVNERIEYILNEGKNYWKAAMINNSPVNCKIRVEIIPTSRARYDWEAKFTWLITPDLANDYYNEGVKMSKQKNYEEAIKFFDEALYLTSKDIDALYNRGVCKFKIGDKTGACEDWQKIKSLDKPDADNLLSKYCAN